MAWISRAVMEACVEGLLETATELWGVTDLEDWSDEQAEELLNAVRDNTLYQLRVGHALKRQIAPKDARGAKNPTYVTLMRNAIQVLRRDGYVY